MTKVKKPSGSSKKKTDHVRETRTTSEQMLDYIIELDGYSPSNNFTSEDYVWIGENEDKIFNQEDFLKEVGFEPEGPLRLLLKAIIAAHESEHKFSSADRLSQAESALLGKHGKRGNRTGDDEDILREVGRRYFKRWHANRNEAVEVAPIVREVLADWKTSGNKAGEHSVVRRLQTKFSRERDRTLHVQPLI